MSNPVRKKTISKSNNLIQKAQCKLDLLDYKCVLYICSLLKKYPDGTPVLEYDLKFTDIFEGLQLNASGRSYIYVKKALENLRDRSIVFCDDSEKAIYWLNQVIAEKNSSHIKIIISADMIHYLFNLRAFFTVYKIENLLCMTCAYSIRMYEILKSYQNLGQKKFDVEELKFLLGIQNKKGYQDFAYFNRRILARAIDEINDLTDLDISYIPSKTGKKYTDILFIIKNKKH